MQIPMSALALQPLLHVKARFDDPQGKMQMEGRVRVVSAVPPVSVSLHLHPQVFL